MSIHSFSSPMPPQNKNIKFLLIFGLFCLQIFQIEPKAAGSFIQLFDGNNDGKVEIPGEINEYYENLAKIQNQLLLVGENETNLASNETTTSRRLGGIKLADFRQFLGAAETENFIDPKFVNASDADGDGELSIGEQTNFTKNFAENYLDADKDGFVSGNESEEYDAKVTGSQFKKYDANNDGKLSGAELKELVHELSVSLQAMVASILPPKKDLRLDTAFELIGKEMGLTREQIEEADVDKNGNLTFREFFDKIGFPMKEAKKRFVGLNKLVDEGMVEKADKNGNGFVDYEELIDMLTVDSALKLGDLDGDGALNGDEFLEGFRQLQALYLNEKPPK